MNSKNLVLITVAIVIVIGGFFYFKGSENIVVDTEIFNASNQPLLGNPEAAVNIIAFEDPNCPACKQAHEYVMKDIIETYVNGNNPLANYTAILLSFLPNSPVVANAAYCVAEIDNEKYYEFISNYFEIQSGNVATSTLLGLAENTGLTETEVDQVRRCMLSNAYADQLAANMELANEVMEGRVSTPRFYINGVMVEHVSHDNIANLIEDNS